MSCFLFCNVTRKIYRVNFFTQPAGSIKSLSLVGCHFADDIALLDVSVLGMQDLTSRVEDAAKLVGLHVNAEKNKDDD